MLSRDQRAIYPQAHTHTYTHAPCSVSFSTRNASSSVWSSPMYSVTTSCGRAGQQAGEPSPNAQTHTCTHICTCTAGVHMRTLEFTCMHSGTCVQARLPAHLRTNKRRTSHTRTPPSEAAARRATQRRRLHTTLAERRQRAGERGLCLHMSVCAHVRSVLPRGHAPPPIGVVWTPQMRHSTPHTIGRCPAGQPRPLFLRPRTQPCCWSRTWAPFRPSMSSRCSSAVPLFQLTCRAQRHRAGSAVQCIRECAGGGQSARRQAHMQVRMQGHAFMCTRTLVRTHTHARAHTRSRMRACDHTTTRARTCTCARFPSQPLDPYPSHTPHHPPSPSSPPAAVRARS